MRYIIIQIDDGGDLRKELFNTREEADKYLEEHENKAYLISTSDEEIRIEDFT